jgi:nicotinate-nucleotide adenylyltransferase
MSQPATSGRRVAFFGGSFDPPHLGHLALARAALATLELDTILFAPVGVQPLKSGGATAGFEDRLEMTRLAIEGEPGFAVSLADAPRADGAPNYTLETIQRLHDELTQDCSPPRGCTLYCLMGADSLAGLRLWHRAEEIPFVAPLIVGSRPGQQLEDLKRMLPAGLMLEPAKEAAIQGTEQSKVALRCYSLLNTAGQRAPFYLLPTLNVEISASQIRDRIRNPERGKSGSLLPDAVAEYIGLHGLYLES